SPRRSPCRTSRPSIEGGQEAPAPSHTRMREETPMETQPKKPSNKGPAERFKGDVWIDPIVLGEEPSRVRVNAVHFMPGARTAWHSHAVGQTLYVTEGVGFVQSRDGDIMTIRPGEIIQT